MHQSPGYEVTGHIGQFFGSDHEYRLGLAALEKRAGGMDGQPAGSAGSFDPERWRMVRQKPADQRAQMGLFGCFAAKHVADNDRIYIGWQDFGVSDCLIQSLPDQIRE